ncbi:Myb-like_DNA-binding domain-containing protein [Hexamita inflata]|uniref:Myb-like DNA-binding domain-containing protein n=1 Tax=Hexamita inflata TaxID=28002 RepID=A0AA86REA2_9EUKA|nr:Myb-like DNA-binding domain-containing protein [Hexamita inflata]
MLRKQQSWTQVEKMQLNNIVEQINEVKQNNRVNWSSVAEQMCGRSPTQCRLQYRNVNKNRSKVNVIWSTEMSHELMLLIFMYGKKWKFLQTNYFPDFTAEQLRLKSTQQEARRLKYKSIYKKIESNVALDEAELKFMNLALAGHQQIIAKFEQVKVNELGQVQIDPLQVIIYNKLTEKNFIVEQEQKLRIMIEKYNNKQ